MRALPPTSVFVRRLIGSSVLGFFLVAISLIVGMLGYHGYEGISWIDSFLNASMILSGMGPVLQPATASGKVFAGLYALYSGFAVLIIAGLMFGPIVHRFLHRFHLESREDQEPAS